MPRARTEEERARVAERLYEVGRDLFERHGLARVTIEELARGAGIGKGTFYQFHPSKEELFFLIQEREEEAFRADLLEQLERARTPHEAVRGLLVGVAERLERHPFLHLVMDPETLRALMLRLPKERVEAHRQADAAYFLDLARRWKRRGWLRDDVSPARFVDVLTAFFVLSTQEALVGRDTLRRAADELATAVADRWCPL